jgi:hypothetical protein
MCPLLKLPPGQSIDIVISFDAARRNALVLYERDPLEFRKIVVSDDSLAEREFRLSSDQASSKRFLLSGWSQSMSEENPENWTQIPFKKHDIIDEFVNVYGFEDLLDSGSASTVDWNDILVQVKIAR